MDTKELLALQFQSVRNQVTAAFKDLDAAQLNWSPRPDANTIGFLIWHALRTWDGYQSMLAGTTDLYESEDWPQRFGFDVQGRGVEGSGTGTGFTPEDVALVKPAPETLDQYLEALFNFTQRYLAIATDESLGQSFQVPWWPGPVPQARVLSHILIHTLMHAGEAQYVRGLLPK